MKRIAATLTLHKNELVIKISKKFSINTYDEINSCDWWDDTISNIFESVYHDSYIIIETVGFVINCDFIEPPYKDEIFIRYDEDNVYRACEKSEAHHYISFEINQIE